MWHRFLTWLTCVTLAWSAAAQIVPPPTGVTVDKLFPVVLPTSIPSRCVALTPRDLATIVLDRDLLEQRAKTKSPWQRDHELLLEMANGPASVLGCTSVDFLKLGTLGHIFSTAIEAGEAVIVEGGSTVPMANVYVRYRATAGFGGNVFYYTRSGQPPFFFRMWWVS